MSSLVLLTNAWGPKYGGINAFNTDFAKALGSALDPQTQVLCVVLSATTTEVEEAARAGVRLVPIGAGSADAALDASRASDIAEAVKRVAGGEVLWWVGHDLRSGEAAVALPKVSGQGRSVVIHHMSYIDYVAYKHEKGAAAQEKYDLQKKIFGSADKVFAIGPLLRNRLADMLFKGKDKVPMLIPGLADIEPAPIPNGFSALTFGRLDPENDRIKQGRLAVAGFAVACRRARNDNLLPDALREDPLLRVIGLSAAGGQEERDLRELARAKAGQVFPLIPLPYEEDRDRLFDMLRGSRVAMMLSWHEGFGLTGWEAIAAEVPLIVSSKSGLARAVKELLGDRGIACLKVIEVRGALGSGAGDEDEENFDPDDEADVSNALLQIAKDPERFKSNASALRTLLLQERGGCTWPNTARTFARELGLGARAESSVPLSQDVATVPAAPLVSTVGPALLELPRPSWQPGSGRAESQLLRPEEACVPFHGLRRQPLQEVIDWAVDPTGLRVAVQFRMGPAGAGKTRLLIEACQSLVTQGWHAGFLVSGSGAELKKAVSRLIAESTRIFMVVDYAETRRSEIVDLLKFAFTSPEGHRIRVMLLAREAGEWWKRLATDDPDLAHYLEGRATSGPYRLPPVSTAAQEREQVFQEALKAFAIRLGKDPAGILPPNLSAPHFSEVLFIHLSALAALFGERPETATSLLEATLRRERHYWHNAAMAEGVLEHLREGVDQAVALLTLAGGAATTAEARRLLNATPRLHGAGEDQRERVLRVLRTFYPTKAGIEPLRPDILGEKLIAHEMAKDSALLDEALGRTANPELSRNSLIVLNRLARQSPSDAIWLKIGLSRHLVDRAAIAAEVAIESGDPVGKLLSDVLVSATSSEQWKAVDILRPLMPKNTIALRECACIVSKVYLERLRSKGRPTNYQSKLRLADAHFEVANRLVDLHAYPEALEHVQEARRLREDLAKTRISEHLESLASCLGTIGICKRALGKHEEAFRFTEEAVAILRGIAKEKLTEFGANLATGEDSLATDLSNLGRYEEAYGHAEKALNICRDLAKLEPKKYRSRLAHSLRRTAIHLGRLERYKDALELAEEALGILLEIAQVRADAVQDSLAMTYSNMAAHLCDLGRYEEALLHAEKALRVFRELAALHPYTFQNNLAESLATTSSLLINLGQYKDALRLSQEAVGLLSEEIGEKSDAEMSILSDVLRRHAGLLMKFGRRGDALVNAEKSLSIRRTIAQASEIHSRGLVTSLMMVAGIRHLDKQHQESLACAEEALGIINARKAFRSEGYKEELIGLGVLRADLLLKLGHVDDARACIRSLTDPLNALERRRTREVFAPFYAEYLTTLAAVGLQSQEPDMGLSEALAACHLYEDIIRSRPWVFRENAAEAWANAAACQSALGDALGALQSSKRGLGLLEADWADFPRPVSPWALDVAKQLFGFAGTEGTSQAYPAVFKALSVTGE